MAIHQQNRVSKTKVVSFNPFVAVRKVVPLKGADLWYRHQDFQIMKNETRRTIICCRMKRDGRNVSTKGICFRGLEEHIMDNPQIIRERRMKTALIVLLEHDRQQDEEGVTSFEKMASRLAGISQCSANRARRKALYDELVARKIYKSSSPISTTTRTLRTEHRNAAAEVADGASSRAICMDRGASSSSTHFSPLAILEKNGEKAAHTEITRFLTSTSLVSVNLLLGAPTRSFQSNARS